MEKPHRIIHIDMDAFFASVEQRDNPELKGKPIAVGGQHRGVVAAASYEARKFGVRSAMPSHRAKKLCPQLIFVRGRRQAYKDASDKVMNILRSYSEKIQQVSIDEAYIDVTEYKANEMTAKEIAIEIRKKIELEVNLTASAGISFNKFLAKVASDCNKPNGLYVIHPNKADKFVAQLAVEKIPGVGKVNKEKLNSKGIYIGHDIISKGKIFMALNFGKMGVYLHNQITFKHFSPVVSKRIRKSIGRERTFANNIDDRHEMIGKLNELSKIVAEDMDKRKLSGRTITLKIKYHNFVVKTRSRTMTEFISSRSEIFGVVSELFMIPNYPEEPVRLLGIQISNLDNVKPNNIQMNLDF